MLTTAVAALCLGLIHPGTHAQGPVATPPETHLTNVRQLTHGGENAEAYFSEDGKRLIFQATRPGYPCDRIFTINIDGTGDGDMEIYSMQADGSDVRRLTNRPGPDGGPFFSWDGRRIVFRGRPLGPGTELNGYRALLKEGLWRPTQLELYVMDRDGGNLSQVTRLAGANFAPSWHPDGKRLIFASNIGDPKGRNFDVYLVNVDGTGLQRITYNKSFDSFPMFSPDGKHLVFASNRNAKVEGETNVFIADWVE